MRDIWPGCPLPFNIFSVSFSVNLCFCPCPSPFPTTDLSIKVSPWPLSNPDPTQRLGRRSASPHLPQYESSCRKRCLFPVQHACLDRCMSIRNICQWVQSQWNCFLLSGLLDNVTVLIGIAHGGKPIAGVINQPFYNYQVTEAVRQSENPLIIPNVRSARRRSRFREDNMGNARFGSLWISAAGSSGWQAHYYHHTFP